MIGLSVEALHSMSRRGIIQPIYPDPKGGKHFRANDLSALAEVRDRKMDLSGAAELAMQAYVISRSNEKRIDDLYESLGFDRPELGVTEQEVVALHIQAKEAFFHPLSTDPTSVRDWAKTLYAIDEPYLDLVRRYVGTEEPWRIFMELGREILVKAPKDSFPLNPDLQSAHGYLRTAYNNLRSVSYFFCRTHYGDTAANQAFHGDNIENVCRLLFPDLSNLSGENRSRSGERQAGHERRPRP
jgi:hypothetical protein